MEESKKDSLKAHFLSAVNGLGEALSYSVVMAGCVGSVKLGMHLGVNDIVSEGIAAASIVAGVLISVGIGVAPLVKLKERQGLIKDFKEVSYFASLLIPLTISAGLLVTNVSYAEEISPYQIDDQTVGTNSSTTENSTTMIYVPPVLH